MSNIKILWGTISAIGGEHSLCIRPMWCETYSPRVFKASLSNFFIQPDFSYFRKKKKNCYLPIREVVEKRSFWLFSSEYVMGWASSHWLENWETAEIHNYLCCTYKYLAITRKALATHNSPQTSKRGWVICMGGRVLGSSSTSMKMRGVKDSALH